MAKIKGTNTRRTVALLLTALIVLSAIPSFYTAADAAATSFTKVNFLQADSRWGNLTYNGSNLTNSGCGILSIVNAVYNCTGNFIQPKDVADWAYAQKYFNQNASGGGGIFDRQVFFAAADKFGAQYGFTVVGGGWGNSYASDLKTHCMNLGTAVVHVYGHFMCLVDYDPSVNKFLVFDCAPGSGGPVNSTNRRYLTTAAGDWKTPAELNTGNISIDAYWLYQPSGADYQPDPNKFDYPERTLKYTSGSSAMTGSDVMWVQAVLFRLGYDITVDGSFGPATAAVVTRFQSDHGLDPDGSCGPATRAKLKEEWDKIDPDNASYSFGFDANGGALSQSADFSVKFGETFTIPSVTAERQGYEFKGWNAKRNADATYYVGSVGWVTGSVINANGYTKQIYRGGMTLTFDTSWTGGCDAVSSYTFYAVWEKITVRGDVNGDGGADSSDAAMLIRYDSGSIDLNAAQISAGDLNGDGAADSSDAAKLIRYDAGVIDSI